MGTARPPSLDELRLLAPGVHFPVTICALFFGDHAPLGRKLLGTLYRHTDPKAFYLRAGLNAVSEETSRLVRAAAEQFGNVQLHLSRKNIRKCPMMRRLFHQPCLETEWTLWFDDDSYVRRSDWLLSFALQCEAHPEADLFGAIHSSTPSPRIQRFIQTASWFRGRPFLERNGQPVLEFAVGGFWAVRSRLISQLDWPDPRLVHFEDDYIFGEALRQRGGQLGSFHSGVVISAAPRRGPLQGPSLLFPS
ncbi:MAG: hypothetical protein ACR2OZ_03015 [Verrucomicrobiales bacterium]